MIDTIKEDNMRRRMKQLEAMLKRLDNELIVWLDERLQHEIDRRSRKLMKGIK